MSPVGRVLLSLFEALYLILYLVLSILLAVVLPRLGSACPLRSCSLATINKCNIYTPHHPSLAMFLSSLHIPQNGPQNAELPLQRRVRLSRPP